MKLQVDVHSPAQFMTAIISDFSSATDASGMHTSALLVGDFSIDGFMSNVVYKLLDVLPLEHYIGLYLISWLLLSENLSGR